MAHRRGPAAFRRGRKRGAHDPWVTITRFCFLLSAITSTSHASAPSPAPTTDDTIALNISFSISGADVSLLNETGAAAARKVPPIYFKPPKPCFLLTNKRSLARPTVRSVLPEPFSSSSLLHGTHLCTASLLSDENLSSPSIGDGWSDSAVTDYFAYGHVHGNCPSCDETSGERGFFSGGEAASRTWTHLPPHTSASLQIRIWAIDTYGCVYINSMYLQTPLLHMQLTPTPCIIQTQVGRQRGVGHHRRSGGVAQPEPQLLLPVR